MSPDGRVLAFVQRDGGRYRIAVDGVDPDAVEAARGAIVDVLDAGRALQPAVAQATVQRPVLAPVPLAVNE